MGYHVTQIGSNFKIKKENIDGAFKAIKDLMKSSPSFRFVDTASILSSVDFTGAMLLWGFDTFIYNEDVVDIDFGSNKLGDEFYLLSAIAPFVENHSYLQFCGEDHHVFRWIFVDGKCREVGAFFED